MQTAVGISMKIICKAEQRDTKQESGLRSAHDKEPFAVDPSIEKSAFH